MKLFIKLLFFVVAQRLFLESIFAQQLESGGGNGSDNSAILVEHVGDSGNYLFGAQLLADPTSQKSDVGEEQTNGNVHFTGPGKINLTVPSGLSFRLCPDCKNKFIVCYESSSPKSNLLGECSSSQCQLFVEGDDKYIGFGEGISAWRKEQGAICENIYINGRLAIFQIVDDIPTCVPKIENGMIQLEIKKADQGCRVEAVGAKIKYPEIITTIKPQISSKPPSSTAAPSESDSTSEGSLPVWAIIAIILGLLAIIIGVGIVGYCWLKKRQSTKTPVDATQPPLAVVTTNNAKESTAPPAIAQLPSKPKMELKNAKPEPSQKPVKKIAEDKPEPTLSKERVKKHVEQKTSKMPEKKVVEEKKTTAEPTTTTEKVSAPPEPSKPRQKPAAPYNHPPPHIVSRSQHSHKSLKTSSNEDANEENQLKPVENVRNSLLRNCIKDPDSDIIEQMKENYPEIKRVILKIEVLLFCVSIGEMLAKMNDMIVGYIKTLSDLGVKYDGKYQIMSMSQEAREYLQDPSTPGTCVLFAFGAEYHEYITDDLKAMPKLSVPHLMAIALQPRFPEYNRRKACSWLRRELLQIRANYTPAETRIMPFPVCMIEKAYEQNPKYFLDVDALVTDSEEDRRKMEEAQKDLLKKKNNEGQGVADGKQKKKSSKKRQ